MQAAITPIPKFLPGDRRTGVTLVCVSILVSGSFGSACYLIAGNTLDFFIGGVLLGCIIAAPLAAIAGQTSGGLPWGIALAIGIGGVWLIPIAKQYILISQWAMCMLVFVTLLLAISSGVLLLMRFGCSSLVSSAIITLAVLAWLTFPVWMSGALAGGQSRWSILVHPLFAINGTLPQLGFWTEQQVAYSLTNLGQDAQYQLPRSAWPAIGFQSALAGVMLVIRVLLKPRHPSGTAL